MDDIETLYRQSQRCQRDLDAITAHYLQTGLHPLDLLSTLANTCANIAESDPDRKYKYLDFVTFAIHSNVHIIVD